MCPEYQPSIDQLVGAGAKQKQEAKVEAVAGGQSRSRSQHMSSLSRGTDEIQGILNEAPTRACFSHLTVEWGRGFVAISPPSQVRTVADNEQKK